MLAAPGPRDLSTRVLGRKINSWRGLDLTIVTPSRWLGECAKASALFRNLRVETIPYGLDLTRFRPFDKALARDILGLPRDKDLILFGAANPDDRRKGFSHLQEAVGRLAAVGAARNAELIVFGSSRPANPPPTALPVHYTGPLNDEISLSLLYSAADVFVAPSLQDNLPNTIMEAMACGTPCVAFRIGGMPDMIDHDVNGFLAPPFDSQALADGVAALLSDPARRAAFGAAARKKCELEFPAARSATAYRELYAELLGHEANKRAG